MSQFDTTPLSYTGDEFSTEEKEQFKVDWDLMGKDFSNATGTLADGNLSSNVALKNINNRFPTTTFGSNNSTSGTNFILGKYTSGNIVTFGAEFGSSSPFIGYGIKHNENASGFVSSTPINIPRSYLKLTGAELRLGLAGSQATAEESPITGLTEKIIYHTGNSNLSTVPWNAQTISTNGVTRIDASGNYTGGSGSFGDVKVSGYIYQLASSGILTLKLGKINGAIANSTDAYIGVAAPGNTFGGIGGDLAIIPRTGIDGKVLIFAGSSGNPVEKLQVNKTGIAVTGNIVASGTVTATGYLPFTGIHLARSEKNLKVGDLVQIKSEGWLTDKQPDWVACYCNGSDQGVYGIVYDIVEDDVMDDYTEIEPRPVMITEKYTEREVQLIDGEYQIVEVEKEREVQAYDEFPIKDSEETHKVPRMEDVEVTKQRKVGSIKKYHIAATGDGFCYTDCPVEYGDYLIPSTTKGLVTAYKGSDKPKNFVGIAGETKTESGKIAWTKE